MFNHNPTRRKKKSGDGYSMPLLTERQQIAILLSMTAQEGKPDDPMSGDDVIEAKKIKKTQSSHVLRVNRPKNKSGETQLHITAMKGDLEGTKSLVKQGADVNCKDNAGWTPLHEACNHGHYKVAKVLLKAGAIVNCPGLDGDTPLHDSSSNGHLKILLLLLKHGGDPHLKNDQGESSIDVAEEDHIKEALRNFTKDMLAGLPSKTGHGSPEKSMKYGGARQQVTPKKKRISNIADFLDLDDCDDSYLDEPVLLSTEKIKSRRTSESDSTKEKTLKRRTSESDNTREKTMKRRTSESEKEKNTERSSVSENLLNTSNKLITDKQKEKHKQRHEKHKEKLNKSNEGLLSHESSDKSFKKDINRKSKEQHITKDIISRQDHQSSIKKHSVVPTTASVTKTFDQERQIHKDKHSLEEKESPTVNRKVISVEQEHCQESPSLKSKTKSYAAEQGRHTEDHITDIKELSTIKNKTIFPEHNQSFTDTKDLQNLNMKEFLLKHEHKSEKHKHPKKHKKKHRDENESENKLNKYEEHKKEKLQYKVEDKIKVDSKRLKSDKSSTLLPELQITPPSSSHKKHNKSAKKHRTLSGSLSRYKMFSDSDEDSDAKEKTSKEDELKNQSIREQHLPTKNVSTLEEGGHSKIIKEEIKHSDTKSPVKEVRDTDRIVSHDHKKKVSKSEDDSMKLIKNTYDATKMIVNKKNINEKLNHKSEEVKYENNIPKDLKVQVISDTGESKRSQDSQELVHDQLKSKLQGLVSPESIKSENSITISPVKKDVAIDLYKKKKHRASLDSVESVDNIKQKLVGKHTIIDNKRVDIIKEQSIEKKLLEDQKAAHQKKEKTQRTDGEKKAIKIGDGTKNDLSDIVHHKKDKHKQKHRDYTRNLEKHEQTLKKTEANEYHDGIKKNLKKSDSKESLTSSTENLSAKHKEKPNNETSLSAKHKEKPNSETNLLTKHKEKPSETNLSAKHKEKPNIETNLSAKHKEKPNSETNLSAKHKEKPNIETSLSAKHKEKPNNETNLSAKHKEKPNNETSLSAKHKEKPNNETNLSAKHKEKPNNETNLSAKHKEKPNSETNLLTKHKEKPNNETSLSAKHKEKPNIETNLSAKHKEKPNNETKKPIIQHDVTGEHKSKMHKKSSILKNEKVNKLERQKTLQDPFLILEKHIPEVPVKKQESKNQETPKKVKICELPFQISKPPPYDAKHKKKEKEKHKHKATIAKTTVAKTIDKHTKLDVLPSNSNDEKHNVKLEDSITDNLNSMTKKIASEENLVTEQVAKSCLEDTVKKHKVKKHKRNKSSDKIDVSDVITDTDSKEKLKKRKVSQEETKVELITLKNKDNTLKEEISYSKTDAAISSFTEKLFDESFTTDHDISITSVEENHLLFPGQQIPYGGLFSRDPLNLENVDSPKECFESNQSSLDNQASHQKGIVTNVSGSEHIFKCGPKKEKEKHHKNSPIKREDSLEKSEGNLKRKQRRSSESENEHAKLKKKKSEDNKVKHSKDKSKSAMQNIDAPVDLINKTIKKGHEVKIDEKAEVSRLYSHVVIEKVNLETDCKLLNPPVVTTPSKEKKEEITPSVVKFKEVDLNFKVGLNETILKGLEHPKKRKRKRLSDSKDPETSIKTAKNKHGQEENFKDSDVNKEKKLKLTSSSVERKIDEKSPLLTPKKSSESLLKSNEISKTEKCVKQPSSKPNTPIKTLLPSSKPNTPINNKKKQLVEVSKTVDRKVQGDSSVPAVPGSISSKDNTTSNIVNKVDSEITTVKEDMDMKVTLKHDEKNDITKEVEENKFSEENADAVTCLLSMQEEDEDDLFSFNPPYILPQQPFTFDQGKLKVDTTTVTNIENNLCSENTPIEKGKLIDNVSKASVKVDQVTQQLKTTTKVSSFEESVSHFNDHHQHLLSKEKQEEKANKPMIREDLVIKYGSDKTLSEKEKQPDQNMNKTKRNNVTTSSLIKHPKSQPQVQPTSKCITTTVQETNQRTNSTSLVTTIASEPVNQSYTVSNSKVGHQPLDILNWPADNNLLNNTNNTEQQSVITSEFTTVSLPGIGQPSEFPTVSLPGIGQPMFNQSFSDMLMNQNDGLPQAFGGPYNTQSPGFFGYPPPQSTIPTPNSSVQTRLPTQPGIRETPYHRNNPSVRYPNNGPFRYQHSNPPAGFPHNAAEGYPHNALAGYPSNAPTGYRSNAPTGYPNNVPMGYRNNAPARYPNSNTHAGYQNMNAPVCFPNDTPTRYPSNNIPLRYPNSSNPAAYPNSNDSVVYPNYSGPVRYPHPNNQALPYPPQYPTMNQHAAGFNTLFPQYRAQHPINPLANGNVPNSNAELNSNENLLAKSTIPRSSFQTQYITNPIPGMNLPKPVAERKQKHNKAVADSSLVSTTSMLPKSAADGNTNINNYGSNTASVSHSQFQTHPNNSIVGLNLPKPFIEDIAAISSNTVSAYLMSSPTQAIDKASKGNQSTINKASVNSALVSDTLLLPFHDESLTGKVCPSSKKLSTPSESKGNENKTVVCSLIATPTHGLSQQTLPAKDLVVTKSTKEPILPASAKQPILTKSTKEPILLKPTKEPILLKPTKEPILLKPIKEPILLKPTKEPILLKLTKEPVLPTSVKEPILTKSMKEPVLLKSTKEKILLKPSKEPILPKPTKEPILPKSAIEPNLNKPTKQPNLTKPTKEPVLLKPTKEPVLLKPTKEPVLLKPMKEPALLKDSVVFSTEVNPTQQQQFHTDNVATQSNTTEIIQETKQHIKKEISRETESLLESSLPMYEIAKKPMKLKDLVALQEGKYHLEPNTKTLTTLNKQDQDRLSNTKSAFKETSSYKVQPSKPEQHSNLNKSNKKFESGFVKKEILIVKESIANHSIKQLQQKARSEEKQSSNDKAPKVVILPGKKPLKTITIVKQEKQYRSKEIEKEKLDTKTIISVKHKDLGLLDKSLKEDQIPTNHQTVTECKPFDKPLEGKQLPNTSTIGLQLNVKTTTSPIMTTNSTTIISSTETPIVSSIHHKTSSLVVTTATPVQQITNKQTVVFASAKPNVLLSVGQFDKNSAQSIEQSSNINTIATQKILLIKKDEKQLPCVDILQPAVSNKVEKEVSTNVIQPSAVVKKEIESNQTVSKIETEKTYFNVSSTTMKKSLKDIHTSKNGKQQQKLSEEKTPSVPTLKETKFSVPSLKETTPSVASLKEKIPLVPTIKETTPSIPSAKEKISMVPFLKGATCSAPTLIEKTTLVPTLKETIPSVPSLKETTSSVPTLKEKITLVPTLKDKIPSVPSLKEKIPVVTTNKETTASVPSLKETIPMVATHKETKSSLSTLKEKTPLETTNKETTASVSTLKEITSYIPSLKEKTAPLQPPATNIEKSSTNNIVKPSANITEKTSTNIIEKPLTHITEKPSTNIIEKVPANKTEKPLANKPEKTSRIITEKPKVDQPKNEKKDSSTSADSLTINTKANTSKEIISIDTLKIVDKVSSDTANVPVVVKASFPIVVLPDSLIADITPDNEAEKRKRIHEKDETEEPIVDAHNKKEVTKTSLTSIPIDSNKAFEPLTLVVPIKEEMLSPPHESSSQHEVKIAEEFALKSHNEGKVSEQFVSNRPHKSNEVGHEYSRINLTDDFHHRDSHHLSDVHHRDVFNDLISPTNRAANSATYTHEYHDLDLIDTSDLLKTMHINNENSEFLSTPGGSITLKKEVELINAETETRLSSDDIISKVADCILEMDGNHSSYTLREYIPVESSSNQPFHITSSLASSIATTISAAIHDTSRTEENNMADIHQAITGHQHFNRTPNILQSNEYLSNLFKDASLKDNAHTSNQSSNLQMSYVNSQTLPTGVMNSQSSMNLPIQPCYTDTKQSLYDNDSVFTNSTCSDYMSESSHMSQSSSGEYKQPLHVNTSTHSRLSSSEERLYSPKHMHHGEKLYSPVISSSTREKRKVNLEPCDIVRSLINSDLSVVPVLSNVLPKDKAIATTISDPASDNNTAPVTASESFLDKYDRSKLPPRMRSWKQALDERCSQIPPKELEEKNIDDILKAFTFTVAYTTLVTKANGKNEVMDLLLQHASQKEKLKISMINEISRVTSNCKLMSMEKGPISAATILYYQQDQAANKLCSTLSFKNKSSHMPNLQKLYDAKIDDLQDKYQKLLDTMLKRHQLEVEALNKQSELDSQAYSRKEVLRQRYFRFRNKYKVAAA